MFLRELRNPADFWSTTLNKLIVVFMYGHSFKTWRAFIFMRFARDAMKIYGIDGPE